jgi:hypothetical protein
MHHRIAMHNWHAAGRRLSEPDASESQFVKKVMHYRLKGIYSDASKGWENESYASPHSDA